jgi:Tol biopolymer transport system component
VYVSNRERGHFAVWRMPADGSGAPEKLFEAADDISEALLAPDDHTLVYRTGSTGNGQQRDVWYVDLSGDRKPKPFLVSHFNESEPRISPDGRWMA